jgi:hypothetical protein
MIKPQDLALILKVARYVSLAVSILLILRMLRTYRRTRSISRKSCVVAMAFPVVTLAVYFVVVGSKLGTAALAVLAAFGLGLGIVQGRKTRVWRENGLARAQNTIWFLAVWAVSYATMQSLVVIGNSLSLNVGIGGMFVSTALAIGSQGLLYARLSRPGSLPERAAVPVVAAAAATVPRRAAARTDGRPSGRADAGRGVERRFCSACGAAVVVGDRFCRNCRAPLA